MQKPQSGERYKHFKGNEYEIICIAKDSETEEEKVVYKDTTNESKIWIRSLIMFCEMKINEEGIEVQRFQKI